MRCAMTAIAPEPSRQRERRSCFFIKIVFGEKIKEQKICQSAKAKKKVNFAKIPAGKFSIFARKG
jgi:hypothetical protein